jgi:hypothetical protein
LGDRLPRLFAFRFLAPWRRLIGRGEAVIEPRCAYMSSGDRSRSGPAGRWQLTRKGHPLLTRAGSAAAASAQALALLRMCLARTEAWE